MSAQVAVVVLVYVGIVWWVLRPPPKPPHLLTTLSGVMELTARVAGPFRGGGDRYGVVRCVTHGVTHRTREPVQPGAGPVLAADLVPTSPEFPPIKSGDRVACALCGGYVDVRTEPAP